MSLILLVNNILLSFSQTTKILFISANYRGCHTECTGDYNQPFDSILNVLMIYNNSDIALTLILIPDMTLDHYILGGEFKPDGSTYYNYTTLNILASTFSSSNSEEEDYSYNQYYNDQLLIFNLSSVSIRPLFCNEYNEILCINDTEFITIHIKISYLNIFCEVLEIRNIIFDGIEDIQQLQILNQLTNDKHLITVNPYSFDNLDKCLYQRIRCCNKYDENTGFSNKFSDVKCIRYDLAFSAILKTFLSDTNFITLNSSNAKLKLTQSTIRNLWMPFNQAFFGLNGADVLVENTNLINNSMSLSIFYFDELGGSIRFVNNSFCNYVLKFDMSIASTWVFVNMMLYTLNPPDNIIMSVNIEDTTFVTNNFYVIIFVNGNQNTKVYVANISISCINDDNSDCNNVIKYSFQTEIQAIEFKKVETLTVIDSIFVNLTGALLVWNVEFLTISNCYFKNNHGFVGGAISAWTDTTEWSTPFFIDIIHCVFESNGAIQGSGLYYNVNGFSARINITNSAFYSNYAVGSGGGIWISVKDPFINSTFYFSNLTVTNNSAAVGGGIILLVDFLNTDDYTNLNGFFIKLQNSTFISNNAVINDIDLSLFSLTHFLSEMDLATTGTGGALYLSCKGHCTSTLTDNNFTSNNAYIYGGALCISEAIIESSSFYNNSASSGGAVFAMRLNYIANPNLDFKIINCNFSNNTASTTIAHTQEEGGALFINIKEGWNMLIIQNSIFQFNQANQRGGAISGSAMLISTTFNFNKANLGGALSSYNYNISKCSFNNNYAYNNNSVYGKGGAIYLYPGTLMLISTISQTKFFANIAEMSGGAITTLTTPPIIDVDNVEFVKNQANVYGDDISAYAVELKLWTNDSTNKIFYHE